MSSNKSNNTGTPLPRIPTIQRLISNAQSTPPNTSSPLTTPSITSTSTKPSPTQAPSIQKDTNNCPICLEPDTTPALTAITKPCNHTFHLTCIKEWIDTAPPHPNNYLCGSCPICRGVVGSVWNRGREVLSGRRHFGADVMGSGRGREGFGGGMPLFGVPSLGAGGERENLSGAAAAGGRSRASADLGAFLMGGGSLGSPGYGVVGGGQRIRTYQEREARRSRMREVEMENQWGESMTERADGFLRPSGPPYFDGRSREAANPEIMEPVSRRQRRMDRDLEFRVSEQRMRLSEARYRLQARARTENHMVMATYGVGNIVGGGVGGDSSGFTADETNRRYLEYMPQYMLWSYYPPYQYGPVLRRWV